MLSRCHNHKCHNHKLTIIKTWSKGQTFDTPFETNCLYIGMLDDFGSFEALDSDGILCSFSVDMVVLSK